VLQIRALSRVQRTGASTNWRSSGHIRNVALTCSTTGLAPALQVESHMRTLTRQKNRARRMVAEAGRKLSPHRRAAGDVMRRVFRDANASHLVNGVGSGAGPAILVAPSGVFVVETRASSGKAAHAHVPDREELREARRAAETVRELLAEHGVDAPWVEAVVCVSGAWRGRSQYRDGVLVARPWQLAYLIRHWRGQVLSAAEADRISAVLEATVPRAAA